MKYSQRVPAALRTLRLLELLAGSAEGLTAGQLAKDLRIPHSALHALLNTLVNQQYVTQAGARQPYHLGPRAQALSRPRTLGKEALLLAFYEETGAEPPEETLALVMLNGDDIVILAEVPCLHTVRSVLSPGHREPAPQHPAGCVLLAGLPDPIAERQLGREFTALCTELHTVRREASAQTSGPEAVTIAVPVCPDGHHPEAALLASIPAFRVDEAKKERLTRSLREMAARISYRLGAPTYMPYGTARPQLLGASVPLVDDDVCAFLHEPWAARLACVRPDGSPHVVTVWYEWQEQAFWLTAWPGSRWAEWIVRKPSVALTIAEPWPPLRRLVARGQAQWLSPEAIPGGIDALYRRISARYLGVAVTTTSPVSYGSGWQAFRIFPDEIRGQKCTFH